MTPPHHPTAAAPATLFSGPAWWLQIVLAWLLLLLALAMAALGVQLLALGGSAYYLLAGVAALAGALLVLRRRVSAGLWCYGLTVLATLAWALWEIHGKGWRPAWGFDLAGRVGLLAGLWLLMALAWWWMRRRAGDRGPRRRSPAWAPVAAVTVLGTLALTALAPRLWPAQAQAAPQAAAPDALGRTALKRGADEWLAFGGSNLGQRFSEAAQITPRNVGQLEQAWAFHTNDWAPNERVYYAFQNTPLKIGDSLYVCSPSSQVFALDPATGRQQWHFDPQVPPAAMEPLFSATCRAVGYHEQAQAPAGELCARRILLATTDSRLIALDAASGQVCPGFGHGGTVNLAERMGNQVIGFSSNTSGPAVVGGLVIVGQQVSDNQRRDAPGGVVRAYDAVTGALRWAWDAKRADDAQAPLAAGELWPRGTPNVWNVISADERLGLVFMGTGNAAADQYGGDRTAAEDAFTSAVVALDMHTGNTRWHVNTVHHDLWDYDLGAQPLVTDIDVDGTPRRVVVQGTKTGSVFVLDARTGEAVKPVQERPVPAGTLPGERYAPTQPQSVGMPNFAGMPGPEPEVLTEANSFGLTPIDAALCRIAFRQMEYEGMYTPPSENPGGILLFPGIVGGMNWGGLAVDPEAQLLITNHSRLPNRITLTPRAQVEDRALGDGGARADQRIAPQAGTPYGVARPNWMSPLQVPCIDPPWGFLSATDLRSGRLLWSRPLGTGFDTGPLGIPTRLKITIGTPNLGGAVVTRSGLTFIAAAHDNYLRAFDTRSGELLWEGRLPAGAQASAMTYMHQGRQYVAIAAGGHARFETKLGDSLVVFALPQGGR